MGQNWRIVLVALLVGLSLSSCSPKPTLTPTLETYPPPAQGESVYPSPGSNLPTNPPPAQDYSINNPYPGPSEGVNNYLDWAKVEELILGGKVSKIYHAQTMHITLVLKDGSVAVTIEPVLDEVFKVIERCGQACSDIEQIKE